MPTLEFKGKHHIYAHHLSVPYRDLIQDENLSCNPADKEDNLIIHGDNLHALKALLPRYANQIKCIYIDPPYNTGKEGWIYSDNVNNPPMQQWFKENGPVDNEDLEKHDKWLCMMWPRLHLLKELLAEDGVIFISIDDNEAHRLCAIMDDIFDAKEIFPNGNFVGQFVWAAGRKNNSRLFSNSHDYILCYVKNHGYLNDQKVTWRVKKQGLETIYKKYSSLKRKHGADFSLIEEELRAWFRDLSDAEPAKRHKHYRYVDSRGPYHASDASAPGGNGDRFDVIHPETGKPCIVPSRGWGCSEETMQERIKDERIHFGDDETSVINVKVYLKETEYEAPYSVFYKDGRAASQRLRAILGKSFPFPKDEYILKEIFEAATGPNDIILDSFAGSGTTAHAVLALNREDGGNRKFILIECEDYAESITAERVRRVINGVENAKDETLQNGLGGSFTYCTLGDPLEIETMLTGGTLPEYAPLAAHLLFAAAGVSLGNENLARKNDDGLFYSDEKNNYYLIYNPDIDFLQGEEAILNKEHAVRIHKACQKDSKKAIVFAAGNYIGQRELTNMGIVFSQLPYALNER